MTNLMPFDELNNLEKMMISMVSKNGIEYDEALIEDSVLDLLIMSYAYGYAAADEMIGIKQEPDLDNMQKAVYKSIAGKTYEQRIKEYMDDGDLDGVLLVAQTESHRIYNEAIMEAAVASNMVTSKMWVTMEDDKVRETHDYLESMIVPLDEKFYSFDGDSADYPGDFERPENNINCRCSIVLIP